MRGRKPTPTAIKRVKGNPGKRGYNHAEPQPPADLPGCPEHLSPQARSEWARLAEALHGIGVLTMADRAALAAYCQAWGRWVEAEERLKETPVLLKTPSGYVQQSPWLSIANKQMELMARFAVELGLTPASRSRIAARTESEVETETRIMFTVVYEGEDGQHSEKPFDGSGPAVPCVARSEDEPDRAAKLDSRL
jgi:P27 family predicted phage terminase small subunit